MCRCSSTAIARFRAARAAPTCSRRWGCRCRWMRRRRGRCFAALGLYLSVCALLSRGDQEHRAGARRARRANRIQYPRSAEQSGRAAVSGGRRVQMRTAELMAQALQGSGIKRAFVIHGAEGWDEPTPVGAFHAVRRRPRRRAARAALAGGLRAVDAALPRRSAGADARTMRASSRAACCTVATEPRRASRRAAARRRAGARGHRPRELRRARRWRARRRRSTAVRRANCWNDSSASVPMKRGGRSVHERGAHERAIFCGAMAQSAASAWRAAARTAPGSRAAGTRARDARAAAAAAVRSGL